jgi:hypothetical protein
MAIEKPKRHKSPDIDHIPAQLIKAGGKIICCETHKVLILFEIRRNCLRNRRRSLYLFIGSVIKQIVIITQAYNFCQIHTKFYPTFCCQG